MRKMTLAANRSLALALAGVMALTGLTGCNKADKSTETETAETNVTETETETETEAVAADDGVMRTGMSAFDYAADMGIGENLGNTLESYYEDTDNKTGFASFQGSGNSAWKYETCWGAQATTQDMLTGMKASGFDTVRIPVYWGNMMADDGTFTINEVYMARVKEVVDYARNADLYVVINMHHYDEMLIKNLPQDEALAAVSTVWTQIATEFRDYSDYVIFEGFNENVGSSRDEDNYTEDETYAYVNALNQTFVDAVRATGGNNEDRMLIVSGYWTNIDNTTNDKFQMPNDTATDRLMVSVHYVDNVMYWTNQIGNQKWLDYATEQCELLKAKFTDNGIPVFMGETTSIYTSDRFAGDAEHTDSTECVEIILRMLAEDYGFVPVLWDVADNFYSRRTYTIINDADAQMIADLSAELREKRASTEE